MKIYFVGSISGKSKYVSHYKKIVSAIKSLGHEVFEITLGPTKEYVYGMSDSKKVEQYERILKWINQCDVVVAESSYPSMGVGYEISLALEKSKPVVVLYEEGHAPHLLEGLKSDKLLVLKYELDDIKGVIEDAIDYASDQADTRFNFFISTKHQNYLDWIAKVKKTPRAVHLRRLLEKDMEVNKSYQSNLGAVSKGKRGKKR